MTTYVYRTIRLLMDYSFRGDEYDRRLLSVTCVLCPKIAWIYCVSVVFTRCRSEFAIQVFAQHARNA